MRYLVADGAHVETDTPYAEVEVMKMCMPLLAPASGTIHFKLAEGQPMLVRATSLLRCLVYCHVIAFSSRDTLDSSILVLEAALLR